MKDFEYFSPESIAEASDLLSQYGEEAKVIAGGQSLVLLLRQGLIDPPYVINIKGISDLDYIRYDEGGGLRIGALTPHRSIETSLIIKEKFPVLAEAESNLASVQVRNWGTIGGNLCLGDPASDMMPPLVALGATVELTGKEGPREAALADFFIDYYETALAPDKIMTEIRVPPPKPYTGTSYSKVGIRMKDRPTVGVCTSVTLRRGKEVVDDVKIVLGAAAPTAMHAKRSEELLVGKQWREDLITEAASLAAEDCNPAPDVSASEEYKREMVKVLVLENLKRALERAKGI